VITLCGATPFSTTDISAVCDPTAPGAIAIVEEIEGLSGDAKAFAQGAAVSGESFEPELAAEAAGIDGEAALVLLDQLIERDLIRPTDVPLRFRTLEQVFSSSLDQRRFSLLLFGIFAVVALLIASIGIYGVIAHAVTQRTQEFGIRIALGAQSGDITKMVVGQGMKLALIGTAIGLLASFAVARLMKGLLFGVSAADPVTFGLIALLLAVATLLASYIPARRATKVDPIIALRYE